LGALVERSEARRRRSSFRNVILLKYRRWTKSKKNYTNYNAPSSEPFRLHLDPWSRVLVEKLIVSYISIKSKPEVYNCVSRASGSCPEADESSPCQFYFFKIYGTDGQLSAMSSFYEGKSEDVTIYIRLRSRSYIQKIINVTYKNIRHYTLGLIRVKWAMMPHFLFLYIFTNIQSSRSYA
jgi:hypothetical protein